MHDVAEPLDDHLLFDLHRAVPADAADVVSPEVQEHDMLRALFGVGQKFGSQRGVLFVGGPTAAGAGDRPDGDLAGFHLHHDFR